MRLLPLALALLFISAARAASFEDEDVFDMDLFSAEDEETLDNPTTSSSTQLNIVGGFAPSTTTDPDVVEATNHVFEQLNKALRDCKKPEISSLHAVVAKKDPSTKYMLLKLELEDNNGRKYMADIRKVPSFLDQFRRDEGGQDRRKHWKTQSVVPNPCSNAQLAYSFAEIEAHNSDPSNTWTATMYPEMIGTTKQAFATGVVIPDLSKIPEENKEYFSEADVQMRDEPPESYDFRTEYPECRATKEVLDQGSCGSCYAQATATSFGASLYKTSNKRFNIKMSAREMADCTRGCDGGWAASVYDTQNEKGGFPEESCDPETKRNEGCGPKCSNPLLWKNKGYRQLVPQYGASPAVIETRIRQALMEYGPLWVAFGVPRSFFSYRSGVYSKRPEEPTNGGHAVVIVGWGTEGGVPYWIVQNSWSAGWGERGFFRIRRGTNELTIETWGVVFVAPETYPANLPKCDKDCKNGGSIELPCKCKCAGLYTGDTCETCPSTTTCQNGGEFDTTTCKCKCPPGISGLTCGEEAFKFSSTTVCKRKGGADLTISWNSPSPKGSMCQVSKGETILSTKELCGRSSDWRKDKPNCPNTGKIVWKDVRALELGDYQLECARFLGKNEFGQDRGYEWMGRNGEKLVATLSVLDCGSSPSPSSKPVPKPVSVGSSSSSSDEDHVVTSSSASSQVNIVGGFAPAPITDPDVVAATAHVFEQLNKALRNCKKPEISSLRAIVAKKDPSTKYMLLKLELEDNNGKKFLADVRKVPKFLNEFRSKDGGKTTTPKNWKTQSVVPNPCSNAKLAYSFADIEAHNSDPSNTWTATMYPEMIGTTKQAFFTGVSIPDISEIPEENIEYVSDEDIQMRDDPPESYDFRTEYPECRATNEVLDQGSCGSCYAQATATSFGASLYKATNKHYNIKMSAREMADCVRGCDGGWAGSVYDTQNANGGFPEESCDPDTHKNEGCGAQCGNAILWKNKGYRQLYPTDNTSPGTMEKRMRQAIMEYGPLWVAFGVPNSFFSYRGGVYSKGPQEGTNGGHAVTVVGWGTEGGIPYWIVQNSWSSGWGEQGYFRIRRGTDEIRIESWGVIYVIPETSPANLRPDCNKECKNGGTLELPCSCKCNNLFTGDNCETCPDITCENGGVVDQTNCKCTCPPGIGGLTCGEVAFKFNTDTVCARSGGPDLSISWNSPNPVGSYCQLASSSSSFISEKLLCGHSSLWSKERPNCPPSGSVVWSDLRNRSPGEYEIQCARFLGMNEFGQSRGYQWMGRNGEKLTATVTVKNCGGPSPRPSPWNAPKPAPRPTPRKKKSVNVGSGSDDDSSSDDSSSSSECGAKQGRCIAKKYCQGAYYSASLGCGSGDVCCKGTIVVPDSSDENDDGCKARGGSCAASCSGNFLRANLGCKGGQKCCMDGLLPAAQEEELVEDSANQADNDVDNEDDEEEQQQEDDLDSTLFDALYGGEHKLNMEAEL